MIHNENTITSFTRKWMKINDPLELDHAKQCIFYQKRIIYLFALFFYTLTFGIHPYA